jgi:uncharacterized protein (DUF433 family)
MELEQLINKINTELKDIKEHLADFCYISVEDCEAILEYLRQLQTIEENI